MNKELLNQLSENKIKVDVTNIREVASVFKDLDDIAKKVKNKMDKLKGVLLKAHAEEYFLDEGMQVKETLGAEKTYIDNKVVIEEIGIEKFIDWATITKTSLEEIGKDWLADKAKKSTGKRNNPSIKVSKIPAKELSKLQENQLKQVDTLEMSHDEVDKVYRDK